MAKKIFLVERAGVLTIPGRGEFSGEVPTERYESLIKAHPQLKDQFEVVEETVVTSSKETAKKTEKSAAE